MVELAELDPHGNATDPRGRAVTDDRPLASEGVPTTAATTAFDHDMRPLVGPDGGFSDDDENKENHENQETEETEENDP